jgi:aminocarboxymuconate-semialdehyde decarboxylase
MDRVQTTINSQDRFPRDGGRKVQMSAIIDMHVHYYTDRYLEAVESASSTQVTRRAHDGRFVCDWREGIALTVPQPHPGVPERLEMMDRLGVATQVLSVPSPSVFFLPGPEADELARAVNEDFAGICRDHSGRFRALGSIVMQETDLALTGIEHVLDELQLDGVMILTNVDGVPLDDTRFEPVWEAANERKLLLYVHPTVPEAKHLSDYGLAIGVGFLADTNLALARLAYSGVFERYPDIRWVFSHLGGTMPFMLPRLDSYHRQFPEYREKAPRPPSEYIKEQIFDTATSHRPAVRCAAETLGLDRLVFGSDYPHVPGGVEPFLAALDATGADNETMQKLVTDHAATLLSGADI